MISKDNDDATFNIQEDIERRYKRVAEIFARGVIRAAVKRKSGRDSEVVAARLENE